MKFLRKQKYQKLNTKQQKHELKKIQLNKNKKIGRNNEALKPNKFEQPSTIPKLQNSSSWHEQMGEIGHPSNLEAGLYLQNK